MNAWVSKVLYIPAFQYFLEIINCCIQRSQTKIFNLQPIWCWHKQPTVSQAPVISFCAARWSSFNCRCHKRRQPWILSKIISGCIKRKVRSSSEMREQQTGYRIIFTRSHSSAAMRNTVNLEDGFKFESKCVRLSGYHKINTWNKLEPLGVLLFSRQTSWNELWTGEQWDKGHAFHFGNRE